MEGAEPDCDVGKLEAFVLECGAYGSEENKIAIDRKRNKGVFGYVVSRIFMPYDLLAELYPIILKRKWMTPFCQMARWFKLIGSKRAKKAFAEIKANAAISARSVEEMQEFLDYIGLAMTAKDNENNG